MKYLVTIGSVFATVIMLCAQSFTFRDPAFIGTIGSSVNAGPTTNELPTDYTGLAAWWSADQITGIPDGANVTNWADLSGNSRTLTQGNDAARPVWMSNFVNGLPAVYFNSQQFLTNNDLDTVYAGEDMPCTAFAVVKKSATNVYSSIWSLANTGDNSRYWALTMRSGADLRFEKSDGSSSTLTGTTLMSSNWYTITMSGSGVAVSTWQNETLDLDGVAQDKGAVTLTHFALGCLNRPTTLYYLTGMVAEAFFYTNELSSGDRQALWKYLKDKYGHY